MSKDAHSDETDKSGSVDMSGTGSCATFDGVLYGRLRVLCVSPFRHESVMHSLGGLFRCLHQALNFLSVRPPSTSASRRGWEPNFGLPLHGVSLYLIVLDKLFQVLIFMSAVAS